MKIRRMLNTTHPALRSFREILFNFNTGSVRIDRTLLGRFFTTTICLLTIQESFSASTGESDIRELHPPVWLDASESSSIELNPSKRVASWRDRSGNNNDAKAIWDHNEATWPKYVKNKTVGGASVLACGSGFLVLEREIKGDALSAFCVVGPKYEDDFSGAIFGGVPGSKNGGIEFRVGGDDRGNVLELLKQNDEPVLYLKGKLPTDRLSVVGFILKPNVDGTATATFFLDSEPDIAGKTWVKFSHGFQLIGVADGTDDIFHGYVAEIIVFTRALDNEDTNKVLSYLKAKYDQPNYPKPTESSVTTVPTPNKAPIDLWIERVTPFLPDIAIAVIAIVLGCFVWVASKEPNPTTLRQLVVRVFLGLCAAAIGAAIPGVSTTSLEPTQQLGIKATGAIVLLLLIYLINPGTVQLRASNGHGNAGHANGGAGGNTGGTGGT